MGATVPCSRWLVHHYDTSLWKEFLQKLKRDICHFTTYYVMCAREIRDYQSVNRWQLVVNTEYKHYGSVTRERMSRLLVKNTAIRIWLFNKTSISKLTSIRCHQMAILPSNWLNVLPLEATAVTPIAGKWLGYPASVSPVSMSAKWKRESTQFCHICEQKEKQLNNWTVMLTEWHRGGKLQYKVGTGRHWTYTTGSPCGN